MLYSNNTHTFKKLTQKVWKGFEGEGFYRTDKEGNEKVTQENRKISEAGGSKRNTSKKGVGGNPKLNEEKQVDQKEKWRRKRKMVKI
jgi:hypothetical protein